jgi:hypothetical protein
MNEVVILNAILTIEISEAFCFGVKAADAGIGRKPDPALPVFYYLIDGRVLQSVFFRKANKLIGCFIEEDQPYTLGAYPYSSLAVT